MPIEISDDITALHITTEQTDEKEMRETWAEQVEKPARAANCPVPRLEIVQSPYRQLYEPVVKFVRKMKSENKDRIIAVVVPELAEPHWYEYLLHNLHAACLKTALFLEGDQRIVVISTPWYVKER